MSNYTVESAYDKNQDLRVAFHANIFKQTKAVLKDKTKMHETILGSIILGKNLYGFDKFYLN